MELILKKFQTLDVKSLFVCTGWKIMSDISGSTVVLSLYKFLVTCTCKFMLCVPYLIVECLTVMDTYRGDIIRGKTRYVLWPTAKITANKAKKKPLLRQRSSV
jgi:hypothetical protein